MREYRTFQKVALFTKWSFTKETPQKIINYGQFKIQRKLERT